MTKRRTDYLCGAKSVAARGHLAVELRAELARLDEEILDPVQRLRLAIVARSVRLLLSLLAKAPGLPLTVMERTEKNGKVTEREKVHPVLWYIGRTTGPTLRALAALRGGGAAERDEDPTFADIVGGDNDGTD